MGFAKYLNPWAAQREKAARRLDRLRQRDGDNCRRCRRPLRFDLPRGHDQAPTVEHRNAGAILDPEAIEDLVLCHTRCHSGMIDHTSEVLERMKRKNEAELFAKAKKKRKTAQN